MLSPTPLNSALAAPLRLVFLLVFATTPLTAEERQGDLLDLVLRSPEEARGDYDALTTRWLEALPRHREDDRAELIARRILEVSSYLKDPTAQIDAIESVLREPGGDGWWRSVLRSLLARLYRSNGEEERAIELDKASGLLRSWWIIGPFDKRGERSIDTVFPPEREQVLTRTYEDGWQTLSWRAVRLAPHQTRLRTPDLGYPSRGYFYALTQFESQAATRALLVRGATDNLRVWLNGHLVVDDDAYKQFVSVPRATELELAPGWNRLLVKTSRPFWMRLTDLDGHPLVLPTGSGAELAPASSEVDPRVSPDASPPRDPLSRWRAEWPTNAVEEAQPGQSPESRRSADNHLGLALLALEYARDDIAVEAAEKALELAPGDPVVLYHAGRVFQSSSYLPSTLAKNRAQAAFTRAVTEDPDFLPAHERLASDLAADKKFAEAVARIGEALDRSPAFLRGLLRQKEIFREAEWRQEEIATVRDIERQAPRSTVPALFWARYYSARRNLDAAKAAYEKALELDGSQVRLLGDLADIEIERGETEAAEAHLREWVRKAPESRSVREEWIDFLVSQKRYEEALEEARALRGRHPQDPRWPLRVASVLESMKRPTDALDEYRAALALEPGRLDLRRYLEARQGRTDRFWEPYDERLEDWIEKVPTSGPLVEEASSIAILDIGVLRLERDGSSTSYVHQAFKLLSEESKKLAEVQTPGEIVKLRTLTADGEVLEPVPATGKTQYVMPGLSPGAVIEFAYRSDSEEQGGRTHTGERFYFQDPGFGQSFLLSRYIVLLEAGVNVEFDETNLEPSTTGGLGRAAEGSPFVRVDKTERLLDDGTRVVIYEARHASRIKEEPLQPAVTEYVPNVRVVDPSDWDAVSQALRRAERGTTRPTAELRKVARKITAGLDSPLEKARALYRHVNEIVPTPRGPSRATRVLLEKAGDRTVLFKALLDLAGVSCEWAYIRPREDVLARTNWVYPSTSKFPFRHVAIEDEDARTHFVTLTSRTMPFGLLPDYFYGGRALVLGPETTRIVHLPGLEIDTIATSLDIHMQLADGVGGEVELTLVSRVAQGYAQKERFRTIQGFQKNIVLQGIANRFFPGARLKEGDFVGVDDDVTPFTIHAKLTAPRLLRSGEGVLLLKALPQPSMLVRTYGGKRHRQHPFHLRSTRVSDDRVEIQLSDAYRLERAPRSVVFATALGDYSLNYEHRGDRILVRRRLAILPGRLAPDDHPAFVDFCERVDAAETENIVLRKKG